MNGIRTRLGINADGNSAAHEAGMTLVEVLVAMVIFAIMSTGVIYSMISVVALTRDSRSIQVASNLAAEEIDLARGVADIFTLLDQAKDVQLNGDTFHVTRTTNWISDPNIDLVCGSGGGALRYKRVDINVTWDNMASPSSAVTSYTVIDPKNRINDPAKGTILVSVRSASGAGASDVTVTATPSSPANGATALTTSPARTDAQGCTYILKVTPGNYDVTIARSDYVDENQKSTPVKTVGVGAGSTSTASFTYDHASDVTSLYADGTSGSVKIPTNLDTSFLSTYPTLTSAATSNSKQRAFKVFPIPSGYTVLAGKHVAPSDSSAGCEAVDPGAWPTQVVGSETLVGVRPVSAATVPGGATQVTVPMGYVQVAGGSAQYLKAVSVDSSPRCQVAMTYTFGQVLPADPAQSVVIGLPFGTWTLYVGTSSTSQTTAVPLASMVLRSRGTLQMIGTQNTVTLDPREVAP